MKPEDKPTKGDVAIGVGFGAVALVAEYLTNWNVFTGGALVVIAILYVVVRGSNS